LLERTIMHLVLGIKHYGDDFLLHQPQIDAKLSPWRDSSFESITSGR
jgi:hypothetical protein